MNIRAVNILNTKLLIVATVQQWRARDLADNTLRDWHIRSSLGFDIPTIPTTINHVRWWTPQEHAARLLTSGYPLTLQAPPPDWLATLPAHTTKREIWTGTIETLHTAPTEPLWWKPATIKHPRLPATLCTRDTIQQWAENETSNGHNINELILQGTSPVEWTSETRCWILNKQVIGASTYLHQPRPDTPANIWSSPTFPHHTFSTTENSAAEWCQQLLNTDTITAPDGAVIDIGHNPETGHSIIEANPAWASAWYGTPASTVIRTVDAAGEPNPHWSWQPDPHLLTTAEQKRPLPTGGNLTTP